VVDRQNRADLLARNHFRQQGSGAGSFVPLHRRIGTTPRRIQAGLNGLSPDEYEQAPPGQRKLSCLTFVADAPRRRHPI
jgi:hypothetical protein